MRLAADSNARQCECGLLALALRVPCGATNDNVLDSTQRKYLITHTVSDNDHYAPACGVIGLARMRVMNSRNSRSMASVVLS